MVTKKVENLFYKLTKSQTLKKYDKKLPNIRHIKNHLLIGCENDSECYEGDVCNDNGECGKYSFGIIEK